MIDFSHLQDFLSPVSKSFLNDENEYDDFQIGHFVDLYEDEEQLPDFEAAHIILLGVGEQRGGFARTTSTTGPDIIRSEFYRLYHWHRDLKIADAGNLLAGNTLIDAYAAMRAVLTEFIDANKTVIILGGSHDLTYAQYRAYADKKYIIEISVADALIDLMEESSTADTGFLMQLFTEQPNYIRHYNHIGFQSYFVQPRMLETLDKLRFDCFRLGKVRENLEEIEPVLRTTDMFSVDLCMIKHSDSPANTLSPNGFSGEEACALSRYAGMSSQLSTYGLYGYNPAKDKDHITAKQVAQMLWYFMDGRSVKAKESMLHEREAFLEFHVASEINTTFLKSKKTGRWWMQLPDKQFIPCAYSDYLIASNNEIPERWLRSQERL